MRNNSFPVWVGDFVTREGAKKNYGGGTGRLIGEPGEASFAPLATLVHFRGGGLLACTTRAGLVKWWTTL